MAKAAKPAGEAKDTKGGRSGPVDLGTMPEWNLDDLYPGRGSKAFEQDLARAETEALAFKTETAGKLDAMLDNGKGGAALADRIRAYEALSDLLGRIGSYAGLMYASDNEDPAIAKFYGDTQEKLTAITNNLLFFELELNRLDDKMLDKACRSPELAHYRPWLDDLRAEKPYQLSDEIETLFHEKSVTGRGAWNRLFNETMTALRFEVGGERLPLERALNLLTDRDGAKRREAAAAISQVLGENIRLFTLITNTLAKDKEISDRWRGFKDIADARHLANRVEREVVDALETAVREAYPRLSHRYYALKAKWLGKPQLEFWDRNAPLPEDVDRVYTWSEARATVLGAYNRFAPRMAEIAEPFFERGWIDAPIRAGKSPGAFAHPTVPSAHPYVLLNYQGKPRDVMTLAHELGHGVHQVLAAGQGPLMASTPLTLAETASVFGEMLTFRAILEGARSPKERRILIAGKVEDMINTVVRQIAFYSFERKLHAERRQGELTAERIGELWMSVQGESLGPSIRLGEGYQVYWSYIPHFVHSPFYVYAYAFGDCLVNSLYAVYRNAETGFTDKYFDMLKAGGTKHHKELLAPFGLDATDPAFWSRGLSMIEGLIDELEAMEGTA